MFLGFDGFVKGKKSGHFEYGQKKKEQRFAPTFVNLKSNTMKNTVQRYGFLANLQMFWVKKYVS